MSEGDICEGKNHGLFFPAVRETENDWHRGIRIPLYGIGLAWCFMGVGLIADVFMVSIERITSKKTRKLNPKTGKHVTIHTWNPTVANLSLMALGSSAPEILLNVIEVFSNNYYAGSLGPGTIVGSAAFNLLCITAVCVYAIPDGESRKINELPVYCITAFFSIFAYLWMVVVLLGISKYIVEVWEGLVTFLFFPLLVFLAYLADKGYFSISGEYTHSQPRISADMTKEDLASFEKSIRQKYGHELTEEQVSKFLLYEHGPPTSRAARRVAATRSITGGRRVQPNMIDMEKRKSIFNLRQRIGDGIAGLSRKKVVPVDDPIPEEDAGTVFQFKNPSCAVLENAKTVSLTVERSGTLGHVATVKYRTQDGRAKAGEDYIGVVDKVLEFGPQEVEKNVIIEIVDDNAFEEDEEFFVELYDPEVAAGTEKASLGIQSSARVTIIDDDLPGVLLFREETTHVTEGDDDTELEIVVERKNGATGKVTCQYATEDGSALRDTDYEQANGVLTFEHGHVTASFKIKIKATGRYERKEMFRVLLTDATGNAKFDATTDGGSESCILTVFIESDKQAKDRVDRVMSILQVNWDRARIGHRDWKGQFVEAVSVNGGDDDDDDDEKGEPTITDWVLHIISLPWKVAFACVPPEHYCGGWITFFCSLIMIGLVTALIGDLAGLFGCVLGMPPAMTAITFVALGTSLPDTFASMSAAVQEPYADDSIGNVTGSNSVNVFLGLGLPWTIASIKWAVSGADDEWKSMYLDQDFAKGWEGHYVVKAETLSYSVIVFCICAIVAIGLLALRRMKFGGELGGPKISKYASAAFLAGLWFLYIILSAVKSAE